MIDLTNEYLLYRECARVVWNGFVRERFDSARNFMEINCQLFMGMLYSEIEKYIELKKIKGGGYYPALRLLPKADGQSVDVLCGVKEDGYVQWSAQKWDGDRVDLRWSDLFDWGQVDGEYREFEYVEAIVVQSDDPTFSLEQKVLIPATKVRVFDVSEEIARLPETLS